MGCRRVLRRWCCHGPGLLRLRQRTRPRRGWCCRDPLRLMVLWLTVGTALMAVRTVLGAGAKGMKRQWRERQAREVKRRMRRRQWKEEESREVTRTSS